MSFGSTLVGRGGPETGHELPKVTLLITDKVGKGALGNDWVHYCSSGLYSGVRMLPYLLCLVQVRIMQN